MKRTGLAGLTLKWTPVKDSFSYELRALNPIETNRPVAKVPISGNSAT